MLSEMREEVIKFMENDKYLSKLKDEKWYEMEDKLVALCEKVSGKKDDTYEIKKGDYNMKDYEEIKKITDEWVCGEASEIGIGNFIEDVLNCEDKDFNEIIPLVNQHFGWLNEDGEIDGLAMAIEEYFEEYGE